MSWTSPTLFLLLRVFLTAGLHTGQSLKPQNLSLVWIDDFQPKLTWAPPVGVGENCTYEVFSNTSNRLGRITDITPSPSWSSHRIMEGGFIYFAVSTICPDGRSEPAVLNVSYPEMVRNVQCSTISLTAAHCSWEVGGPEPLVHFFYRLSWEDLTQSDESRIHELRECSSYGHTGGARTGCDVQMDIMQSLTIVFNGTAKGALFRNTFHRVSQSRVTLPPLQWTVRKTKEKFLISWNPPEIQYQFEKFEINYMACKKVKKDVHEITTTVAELDVLPHCRYSLKMRAKYRHFNSSWTKVETFAADTDPNMWVYPVALVPLLFAGLTVFCIVCYRKHKAHIFPEVPNPRDLLSDISNNNSKSTAYNLCSPFEEEEEICDITLVMDPQIGNTKPHL